MLRRDKPYYQSSPIQSIEKLAETLGVNIQILYDLSINQDSHYHSFKIQTTRPDGSIKERHIHEPKLNLKKIQHRINSRIFSNIQWPIYLHGGIKDQSNPRDYYSNASTHTRPKTLISLDIKNFFDNIKIEDVYLIFKYMFHFSDDVSQLLSKLVTFNARVPQGACTSTYIANLIFYDVEYKIVSTFSQQELSYSRLLDDITVSSKHILSTEKIDKIIKTISTKLISSKNLKINKHKTKVEFESNNSNFLTVTGLWIGHNNPKCTRPERKNIRGEVYYCEKMYNSSNDYCFDEKYHKLWNQTSGKVAKLQRVGHPQSKTLRHRLRKIYPKISIAKQNELLMDLAKLERVKDRERKKLGFHQRLNKIIYLTGILSRTNRKLSKDIFARLMKLKKLESYNEYWEF